MAVATGIVLMVFTETMVGVAGVAMVVGIVKVGMVILVEVVGIMVVNSDGDDDGRVRSWGGWEL